MPLFVSLTNWTEQGITNFKDAGKRVTAFEELAAKNGASLKSIYWTVGPYDIVTVLEAPDDETAYALLLQLGSLGNVRTTTLRAFDRPQFEAIVGKAK